MSQALNFLVSQIKLALSQTPGTRVDEGLANSEIVDQLILDPIEKKKLLDSSDRPPELSKSLANVADMRIKNKDMILVNSPEDNQVQPYVSGESATPLAIKRRNFLLQKNMLDDEDRTNLAFCNSIIQITLLQNMAVQLQKDLLNNETTVDISKRLLGLNLEYNKKTNIFLIPKDSCVPAHLRKLVSGKFIKMTSSFSSKLFSYFQSNPERLKMGSEEFVMLLWECSDEKGMVDIKIDDRKKRKDMEHVTDAGGKMKNDLHAILKEFKPKINLEDVAGIIDRIKKYISYSNDIMLNMKFDSDRQERNKPKVIEKNKSTLQSVDEAALKINQSFLEMNETQVKLLRRHKQLQADIHKFINEGELNKAGKLFSELQDMVCHRNKCGDFVQAQYAELEKLEESLSTQNQVEQKMRCAQLKQNEKQFAKEEQRMLDLLKDIDKKLKDIALAEAENRKMQEAAEARRRRWEEQQKKREQERKEKEEKTIYEAMLQKLSNTPHTPKNQTSLLVFSAQKNSKNHRSFASASVTEMTRGTMENNNAGHAKPMSLPFTLNHHCDFGALLEYHDELQTLQTSLQQISFSTQPKTACVCRMERSALLGIMARAMECLKIKQSGGIIHVVAAHFRNVIFHGFEESLFPKIGEDIKENAEANRSIFDMACRMLAFLNSPGIKKIKTLDEVLLAVDSKLFTTIMKHKVTAPTPSVCQEQILLGDYELLQYDRAKRGSEQHQTASTLYHAAVGFSRARIGTYASFLRRQPQKESLALFHQLKQSMPLKTYIREGINFRHVLTNTKARL